MPEGDNIYMPYILSWETILLWMDAGEGEAIFCAGPRMHVKKENSIREKAMRCASLDYHHMVCDIVHKQIAKAFWCHEHFSFELFHHSFCTPPGRSCVRNAVELQLQDPNSVSWFEGEAPVGSVVWMKIKPSTELQASEDIREVDTGPPLLCFFVRCSHCIQVIMTFVTDHVPIER